VYHAGPTYLSLVSTFVAVQVEEAVTVCTQVPALRTQDDGLRVPVVVVVARGAGLAVGAPGARHPLPGRESLHVVRVQHTQGRQGQPQLGVICG